MPPGSIAEVVGAGRAPSPGITARAAQDRANDSGGRGNGGTAGRIGAFSADDDLILRSSDLKHEVRLPDFIPDPRRVDGGRGEGAMQFPDLEPAPIRQDGVGHAQIPQARRTAAVYRNGRHDNRRVVDGDHSRLGGQDTPERQPQHSQN